MKKLSENTKLLIFLVLLLGILNVFIPPTKTEAFGLFFGGKVTAKTKCTCVGSTNYKVIIKGKTYSYDDSAKLYRHNHVNIGSWVLGRYSASGECKMQVGGSCTTTTLNGTITSVGTSE